MSAFDIIRQRIATQGPITVAEFIDVALYDPAHGYYARAAQRSGRDGDFFTSVDVGPLFGELIAVQLEEMWRLLGSGPFDLVEAGAGNGRLTADILDAAAREFAGFYASIRVTLVERSPSARAAQGVTLAAHRDRIHDSVDELPRGVTGVVLANELLDAFPVHVVVGTVDGAREILVDARDGRLVETEGDLSGAARDELARLDTPLPAGVRAEICPAARAWFTQAARAVTRGFLLLVDYGHEAHELFSETHRGGTLVAYRAHTAGMRRWLDDPGDNDLTSHVNLTAVGNAARDAGFTPLGIVDQTYFLMALGLTERLSTADSRDALRRRLAARTLIMPGGLGSTMKVMLFARGLEQVSLRGMQGGRLT